MFTKEQLLWGLEHLDKLTPHYTEEWFEKERLNGWDFGLTYELEGMWLIPDGDDKLDLDFGDTSSGGVHLIDFDVTAPFEETKLQLQDNLNRLLKKVK